MPYSLFPSAALLLKECAAADNKDICNSNCQCPSGSPKCVGGKCQKCEAGFTECGDTCKNLQTDTDNCESKAWARAGGWPLCM